MTTEPSGCFARWYFAATIGSLAVVLLMNGVVDPLQYYHRPWFDQAFVKNQRNQNAGLIKQYDFDSVVVGTSHCHNFVPSEVGRILGWRSLRVSMSGSTSCEQRIVLENAIASGKVGHVLWCLDDFSFLKQKDVVADPAFPFHLYRKSWDVPFQYLLSKHTISDSFRVLRKNGSRDLETYGTWLTDYAYGEKAVMKFWTDTKNQFRSVERGLTCDAEIVNANVQQNLIEIVKAHPEIDFRLFFPPHPIVCYVYDFRLGDDRFPARIAFKRRVVQELAEAPNCRIYDFQPEDRYLHDLDGYKDLTHFGPHLNTEILNAVVNDECRISVANLDAKLERLEEQVREFLSRQSMPEGKYFSQLKLAKIPAVVRYLEKSPAVAEKPREATLHR